MTPGLPSVSVPILSTTRVLTVSMRSRDSADFMSTPAPAPLPTAAMIDIGVAKQGIQGQATMTTETAAMSA